MMGSIVPILLFMMLVDSLLAISRSLLKTFAIGSSNSDNLQLISLST